MKKKKNYIGACPRQQQELQWGNLKALAKAKEAMQAQELKTSKDKPQ
jgi:hypothetical protein